jgi:hypothetical protein
MRRRRLAAAALGALLLSGVAASAPPAPVGALDQSSTLIRVGENQTVEKTFGPIPGQRPIPTPPAPAPRLDTPDDCRQQPYCDVIPLEVVPPPTLRPSDEFFVTVALSWDTQTIPGTLYTKPQHVNDLDLYVWTDPQGDAPIRESSTDQIPEQLKLFRPTKGRYSIVVMNYIGPNTGYKLTVSYVPEKIVPPFESLDPGFVPPVLTPPATEPAAPPVDLSGEPVATPSPPPASAATEPAAATPPADAKPAPLTPAAVNPDPDFTNFNDTAFDEQLAAPPSNVLAQKQAKAVAPPAPPSAAAVVVWLGLLPLLLVAAGGLWLSRRGSAVLKLR